MHTLPHATRCPIAAFNATLAELGKPWRVEPVLGTAGAYVLSTAGAVPAEVIADAFEAFGEPEGDLAAVDDFLDPAPGTTLGGFVLKDGTSETSGEVAAWAAGKLGLTGLVAPLVLEACR